MGEDKLRPYGGILELQNAGVIVAPAFWLIAILWCSALRCLHEALFRENRLSDQRERKNAGVIAAPAFWLIAILWCSALRCLHEAFFFEDFGQGGMTYLLEVVLHPGGRGVHLDDAG